MSITQTNEKKGFRSHGVALSAVLLLFAIAPSVLADRITTVTATTSMGSGFGTNIINTVNGNGLSSPSLTATHAGTSPANSWVSTQAILTGQITFNLGGVFSVNSFSFWNQNGGGPGTAGSTGIRNVQVFYSTDGVIFTALPGGPSTFAQVAGTVNLPPEIFTFTAVTATFPIC